MLLEPIGITILLCTCTQEPRTCLISSLYPYNGFWVISNVPPSPEPTVWCANDCALRWAEGLWSSRVHSSASGRGAPAPSLIQPVLCRVPRILFSFGSSVNRPLGLFFRKSGPPQNKTTLQAGLRLRGRLNVWCANDCALRWAEGLWSSRFHSTASGRGGRQLPPLFNRYCAVCQEYCSLSVHLSIGLWAYF